MPVFVHTVEGRPTAYRGVTAGEKIVEAADGTFLVRENGEHVKLRESKAEIDKLVRDENYLERE